MTTTQWAQRELAKLQGDPEFEAEREKLLAEHRQDQYVARLFAFWYRTRGEVMRNNRFLEWVDLSPYELEAIEESLARQPWNNPTHKGASDRVVPPHMTLFGVPIRVTGC